PAVADQADPAEVMRLRAVCGLGRAHPSCRADCETPVDHSRSDTSREGKQMTIFLHSARTISRIFVFEAGGLRRRKAVEIRPSPYHFGGGQIQHASLCACPTAKKEGRGTVRGAQESDRAASPAPTQDEVCS